MSQAVRHGTSLILRGNSFSVRVGASLEKLPLHVATVWGVQSGNSYQLHMGRCKGPIQVVQKHGHKCILGARNQVRRHRMYPGHYSGVFVVPENAQNAETKRQSRTVPNQLLASCFNDLRLL